MVASNRLRRQQRWKVSDARVAMVAAGHTCRQTSSKTATTPARARLATTPSTHSVSSTRPSGRGSRTPQTRTSSTCRSQSVRSSWPNSEYPATCFPPTRAMWDLRPVRAATKASTPLGLRARTHGPSRPWPGREKTRTRTVRNVIRRGSVVRADLPAKPLRLRVSTWRRWVANRVTAPGVTTSAKLPRRSQRSCHSATSAIRV